MFREVAAAILNRVSERITGAKWFLIGVFAATALTVGQVMATGDISGLLQVGENSDLRPTIESQLGQVHLSPGSGHDGQIYYAIALDLGGTYVPDLIGDSPAYRYRRILFPAVASAFGLVEGRALLYSMVVLNILAVGLAASTMAVLSVRRGFSDWFALAVILNPGVWLSVMILTGDALSLSLMLVGVGLLFTRQSLSGIVFAGSVLAKEIALITPLGLTSPGRRSSWRPLIISGIAILIWMVWLSMTMGSGFTPRGNLAIPFLGIADSSPNWGRLPVEEWFFVAFALSSILAGFLAGVLRQGPLRWPVLLWSSVGIASSHWVWDFGNNAARVLAPLGILVVLHLMYQDLAPSVDSE